MSRVLRDRFIAVVIGICLSIVGLELFLRLMGAGYNLTHRFPKDKGADFRIFCIGESTTWGTGTPDPLKENYPKQLEDMLNARFSPKKFQCFFDQTIGQNTTEILLKLPKYIKVYNPDLIIMMAGINNWWNMDKSNIFLFNKSEKISNFSLQVLSFLDKFRVWKLIKWQMLSLGISKERWNNFISNPELIGDVIKEATNKYGENLFSISNKLAKHDLGEMVKVCKDQDIKVVIASYPRSASLIYSYHKEIAQDFGVPFVDNKTFFDQLPDLESYLWKDKWHLNVEGYGLVAKNILNCIVENKMLKNTGD